MFILAQNGDCVILANLQAILILLLRVSAATEAFLNAAIYQNFHKNPCHPFNPCTEETFKLK